MPTNRTTQLAIYRIARITFKRRPLFCILAAVSVVWLCCLLSALWLFGSPEGASGIVDSLFASLAFAGVIVAIVMQGNQLRLQRKELKYQRLELKATREELKRSADSQQKSEAALNKQADSLLLAAYLNALSTLRQAYEQALVDGKRRSPDDVMGHNSIKRKMEDITEKLEPHISTLALNVVTKDASTKTPDEPILQEIIEAGHSITAKLGFLLDIHENDSPLIEAAPPVLRECIQLISSINERCAGNETIASRVELGWLVGIAREMRELSSKHYDVALNAASISCECWSEVDGIRVQCQNWLDTVRNG